MQLCCLKHTKCEQVGEAAAETTLSQRGKTHSILQMISEANKLDETKVFFFDWKITFSHLNVPPHYTYTNTTIIAHILDFSIPHALWWWWQAEVAYLRVLDSSYLGVQFCHAYAWRLIIPASPDFFTPMCERPIRHTSQDFTIPGCEGLITPVSSDFIITMRGALVTNVSQDL